MGNIVWVLKIYCFAVAVWLELLTGLCDRSSHTEIRVHKLLLHIRFDVPLPEWIVGQQLLSWSQTYTHNKHPILAHWSCTVCTLWVCLQTTLYQITHSMKRSPWEVNSCSLSQEISCWSFLIVYARCCCWTIYWATWIQSTSSHPVSLRSILVLFFHLCPYF